MFAFFGVPIAWSEVVQRTVKEIGDDNCLGLAALGTVAPQELVRLLREQLAQIAEGRQASLLTLGIIGAIWSSSAAMVAMIDALNRAYDVTEWRPWWKRRLLAMVFTVALALFIIIALTLVLVGPAMAFSLANWLGLGSAVALLWALMLATALWIVSSFAFRAYVTTLATARPRTALSAVRLSRAPRLRCLVGQVPARDERRRNAHVSRTPTDGRFAARVEPCRNAIPQRCWKPRFGRAIV